jgi:hypothetical protein
MRRNGSRSFLPWLAGLATAALLGYFRWLRPRLLRWGATPEEAEGHFPGDDLVADPLLKTTHSITIDAAPAEVWPWLVQIGQGRGGFYSYDWLENLLGMNIHNADRVLPEYQDLHVGDEILFWEGAGVKVMELQNERALVLAGTFYGREGPAEEAPVGGSWNFFLQPESGGTRLIVRSYVAWFPPFWLSCLFSRLLLEPAHFIMERGMLQGIKRRAEAGRKEGAATWPNR